MSEFITIEKIQNKYQKLSSAEKKVADYILKHPVEAVKYTIKELAGASNVSEATVVRMCQHIGYKGYWAFHISLASELGKNEEKLAQRDKGSLQTIILQYANILKNLAEYIDEGSMNHCIELLICCGYAHIIADGNTGIVVDHLAFCLGRHGIRCTRGNVPEYYMNNINLAKQDDVIIAISQSGVTKNVLKGVQLAKQKKLKVIAITAYKNSNLSDDADIVLVAKGDFSRFDFYKNYSHLCEIAVIDALCELIQQRHGNENLEENNDNMLELLLSEAKL